MIGLFNFLLWRVLQQKIASSRLAMRRWSLIWSTICYNAETDKPGRRVPERLLKEQQWCLWYTALRWFAILRELRATVELASCLTNAQSLPAHRPAADDNSLIGCTSHELTNDWSLASTHFVQPVRISVLVLVCAIIKPAFMTTMYRSTIPLQLSDQSALEIRVRIRVRLQVALF